MKPVLLTQYKEKVIPTLRQSRGYRNVMEVPRISKVIVHVGYGRHAKEAPYIEHVEKSLQALTGQKPVHTKAKKAISNFKTRAGMPIAAMVTLRGPRMYEFLYKLIHLALPRVRDFRGVSKKGFDKRGNYSLGLKEHLAFPEITTGLGDTIHGLEITIVTTAKKPDEAYDLLKAFQFPFKD